MGWASVGVRDSGGAAAGQSIISTFANVQLVVELRGPVGPALTPGPSTGGTWGVTASAGHDPACYPRACCMRRRSFSRIPGHGCRSLLAPAAITGWTKQPLGFYSPALNRRALHWWGFVVCSIASRCLNAAEAQMEMWVPKRVGRRGALEGS